MPLPLRSLGLAILPLLAGCGLFGGQAPVCAEYLDCYDAVLAQIAAEPDTADTGGGTDTAELGSKSYLEGLYGADGTCWKDPLQKAACELGCESGLDILRDTEPLPAACAP